MPTLTVFAGTNGTGKSTLYNYHKKINNNSDLGIRINPDDILKKLDGNWQCHSDAIKSAKLALDCIRVAIKTRQSFNWETTIFTPYNIKFLLEAKKQGFTINLYYMCVDSAQTAVERVKMRMRSGGHGIDEDLIRTRYGTQFKHLAKALQYIDNAVFIDNTSSIKIVATYINNILTYSHETTPWVKNLPFVCQNIKTEKSNN